MIPFWKIKRELLRVFQQVLDMPRSIISLYARTNEAKTSADHDRDFEKIAVLTDGIVPARTRFAIFLIYQPGGLSESSCLTCKALGDAGYATLVVSNSFLSETDRARLLPVCHWVLERPNYGYDFGGYRDGIRFLLKSGVDVEKLLIMNDSMWFPLRPDTLSVAEEQLQHRGLDIIGLLQDEKVKHSSENARVQEERMHIESYFYLLGNNVWRSEIFRNFWNDYIMTSDKGLTIKRGEIGFSKFMMSHGFNTGALTSRMAFLENLDGRDNIFLRDCIDYASYQDSDLKFQGAQILKKFQDDQRWRETALAHIYAAVMRRRFNITFSYANDQIFGTLFIKKHRDPVFTEMRRQYLRAIEDGKVAPPPEVILNEVKASVPDRAGKRRK